MSDIIHNNAMPKISIITVVKNGRAFIRQTITSVVEQTYPNKEYIIIDGASTDGTVEIIRSLDSGISKWISEEDGGIAEAFNKGLDLAGGDYMLLLNSDDALAGNGVLEEIARQIIANNYPTMLYGDCNILDRKSGDILYRAVIPYSPDKIRHGQMLPHPSLFTHRSYFERYGKFDTTFRIAMDYEWLIRGVLRERVLHVPLLVSSVREGGVSTQNQRVVISEIVRALRKNLYIQSDLDEFLMRWYFNARRIGKLLLQAARLYKAFDWLRGRQNRSRQQSNGDHC